MTGWGVGAAILYSVIASAARQSSPVFITMTNTLVFIAMTKTRVFAAMTEWQSKQSFAALTYQLRN